MCRLTGALGTGCGQGRTFSVSQAAAFPFSIPTTQNHGPGLFMKSAAIGLWNTIYFKRFGNKVGPEAGKVTDGGPWQGDRMVQSTGLPMAEGLPRGSPSSHGSRVGSRPFQDISLSLLCKTHPCLPSPSSQPQNLLR